MVDFEIIKIKTLNVIESCKNLVQLESALNYCDLLIYKFKSEKEKCLHDKFEEDLMKALNVKLDSLMNLFKNNDQYERFKYRS